MPHFVLTIPRPTEVFPQTWGEWLSLIERAGVREEDRIAFLGCDPASIQISVEPISVPEVQKSAPVDGWRPGMEPSPVCGKCGLKRLYRAGRDLLRRPDDRRRISFEEFRAVWRGIK